MTSGQLSNSRGEKPPLSLERLRAAFSQMLGKSAKELSDKRAADPPSQPPNLLSGVPASVTSSAEFEISPRSIVEAMLFVGRPEGKPLSAREMAAAMRGVSPAEVEAAVQELNEIYEKHQAPYEVSSSQAGFALGLREEFARVRDKFYGRVRGAKLTPAAMEVLAVVAYQQPVTLARINELRGTSSGSVLAMLVRRQLVRLERPDASDRSPVYFTTERFLRLFRLAGLEDLPRLQDLDAA